MFGVRLAIAQAAWPGFSAWTAANRQTSIAAQRATDAANLRYIDSLTDVVYGGTNIEG